MAGSAKGSGMIEPNMGTMLAFLTTDANIEPEILQLALKEATDKTFNCITVDGDTSTNDMVLTMASGKAGNESLTPEHSDWEKFTGLLRHTCEDLAKMIARDGEGATKLIEVEVSGAYDDGQAVKVAKTIVGSSLVKTAVYGSDPNWGRIIAAIGRSGADVNAAKIDTSIGPFQILQNSQPLSFSETDVSRYMQNDDVKISVDLNVGNGTGKAWGCDLTYDYVRINASYRT
jgi:glutamate N-acetyltransferase/amino-acid N-acetyltransferase